MNNLIKFVGLPLLLLCAVLMSSSPLLAADLMIAGFENGGLSDISTYIGTWNYNPLDTSQGCTMDIVPLRREIGGEEIETHVLKISYDVASSSPAFNGVYIKLNNRDLASYVEMSMLIKGGREKGFTTKFKVELKNIKGERAVYVVKGIIGQWQKIVIPMQELKALGSITDWSQMNEILFTFDDITVDYKEGVLYVDDIKFSTKDQTKQERQSDAHD